MSKINQIQNALKTLSGGAFQKLIDDYLHQKGYEHINSLGSVVGADKVRVGTPDTLIPLPNGKYVFAEHTTQEKDIRAKFEKDIDKCFDEKKTGIPVNLIKVIALCYIYPLGSEDTQVLIQKCRDRGVNINFYGLETIAQDLYRKYPGLARDHLGVNVDTGQIVSPQEFIATYNKGTLATPLDTTFHFREKEIVEVLDALNQSDLVVVSGRAGVGKTRLALKCCEQFIEQHPEYAVKCIFNRYHQDLFEDIRVYFSNEGHYLILVDDANRISRFDYFVQLLLDQREDQQIKIIVTVRDYACDEVLKLARSYGMPTKIELHPFSEKEITQLVEDEYEIRNHHYQERIVDIAKGNPRLAIMAAQIARREKTLRSINNVSSLYDEYYDSVQRDLENLNNPDLIKVAGIVTFFRAVFRSNEQLMESIEQAFNISPERFWEIAQQLHNIEVLDIYEDEIVRTSDQVLATYLFYLSFFKKASLSFSSLLEYFFPALKSRFIDALNSVWGAFSGQSLNEIMRPAVAEAWGRMKSKDDEEGLLQLIDLFWFLKPTDTLLYIKKHIDGLGTELVPLSDLEFKTDTNIPYPSYPGVLCSFQHLNEQMFRMALNLLFDYLTKRPSWLPKILYLLTDKLGFKRKSYLRGFTVQRAVIDVLCYRTQKGENELFSKLFLVVATQYLHTYFHTTESRSKHTVNVFNFRLSPTPELLELRKIIWKQIALLYHIPNLQDSVLDLVYDYIESSHWEPTREFIERDATIVLPFIESALNPAIWDHCLVVQDYLDILEHHGISFDKELREQFEHKGYTLIKLLLDDRIERQNLNLDDQQCQQLKLERLREHFSEYDFNDYKLFFSHCVVIQERLDINSQGYQLQTGAIQVLLILADRNPDLYAEVVEFYRDLGNPLRFNSSNRLRLIIIKLIEVCGNQRTYEIINASNYPSKTEWLFSFYRALPDGDVTNEQLHRLYALYQKAKCEEIPVSMDFLLKYRLFDNEVVANTTRIIFEKTKENPKCITRLSSLFNEYTEICKDLFDHFAGKLDLLKQVYLAFQSTGKTTDYYGQTFTRILDRDPSFIIEYINQSYEKKDWLSSYDENRDFTFLWRREDHQSIMFKVAKHIIFCSTYIKAFFKFKEGIEDAAEILQRQETFLKELISQQSVNPRFAKLAFDVVADFLPDRRLPFIALFLESNKNFTDFMELLLEPRTYSCAIPAFQKRVNYYESLLPLFDTVDLLQHRQYVERHIQNLHREIEQEKKRNFIGFE